MNKGFSLLELFVIVLTFSTLLSISMLSFNYWKAKNNTKNFVFELASEINYARDLSRKEGKRVIFALVNPGADNQNWTGNNKIDPVCYFIFEDDNKNGTYDNGEKIVSYNKCKSVKVTANTLMRSYGSNGKCIIFFPIGLPLIGDSDKTLTFQAKTNSHVSYSIKIHSVTGIGEIIQ